MTEPSPCGGKTKCSHCISSDPQNPIAPVCPTLAQAIETGLTRDGDPACGMCGLPTLSPIRITFKGRGRLLVCDGCQAELVSDHVRSDADVPDERPEPQVDRYDH